MIKLIAFISILSFNCLAQSPTIIFGQSELPDNKSDSVMLIQPENSVNPLGNPIVTMPQKNEQINNTPSAISPQKSISYQQIKQTQEQDPQPFQETPQKQNNQIDNTLYQGGNRIYDIQSYPIEDINKITEPNIQPTITTYPAY